MISQIELNKMKKRIICNNSLYRHIKNILYTEKYNSHCAFQYSNTTLMSTYNHNI